MVTVSPQPSIRAGKFEQHWQGVHVSRQAAQTRRIRYSVQMLVHTTLSRSCIAHEPGTEGKFLSPVQTSRRIAQEGKSTSAALSTSRQGPL